MAVYSCLQLFTVVYSCLRFTDVTVVNTVVLTVYGLRLFTIYICLIIFLSGHWHVAWHGMAWHVSGWMGVLLLLLLLLCHCCCHCCWKGNFEIECRKEKIRRLCLPPVCLSPLSDFAFCLCLCLSEFAFCLSFPFCLSSPPSEIAFCLSFPSVLHCPSVWDCTLSFPLSVFASVCVCCWEKIGLECWSLEWCGC